MAQTPAVQLIKISFDSMENNNPIREDSLAFFIAGNGLTAQGNCSQWITQNLGNVDMYLGYDGKVYPQFRTQEIQLLS